jgi:protein involved in polysaccharide export with SLBB domain
VEENEPPVRAIIAATGELEIPGGLGRVMVNGMTSARAEDAVRNYLEGRYYKRGKATVKIGLNFLPASGQKKSKVIMSGKLLRAGAVDFYSQDPKTVSEAVNEAGTTIYSDTKRVQVTRGTEKFEINVKDILENGNTSGDMKLRDGDRIYVPERGIVFGK